MGDARDRRDIRVTYTHTHTHMHTYTRAHAHIHTYTHTHIYTHTLSQRSVAQLPALGADIVQRLRELLSLFNTRSCHLVLGARAMHAAGLPLSFICFSHSPASLTRLPLPLLSLACPTPLSFARPSSFYPHCPPASPPCFLVHFLLFPSFGLYVSVRGGGLMRCLLIR